MDTSPAFPTEFSSLPRSSYVIIGTIAQALLLYSVLSHYSKTRKLRNILSVGSDLPLLSLWTTFRYITDARGVLDAGMRRWPRRIFKVPTLLGWEVVLTESSVIDELRKAPDNVMGAIEAFEHTLQAKRTIGANIITNRYHVPIVRAQLTRALPQIIPELHEEMVLAFNQYIPATESWSRIKVTGIIQNIVARTTNRILVGVPLCRDPGWIDISVGFTKELVTTSILLRTFPSVLRPWVYTWFSQIPEYRRRASQYLAPLITARQKELGNSDEKPLDFLTWLLNEAKGEEATLPFLVLRFLVLNFASIHTTSITFTHALYYLAACPEYVQALREEVEEVTRSKGWTKASLDEMYKIDSFIKESQRLNPVGMLLMKRSMLQDYTFSDGTTIPAGSTVAVRVDGPHHNADLYPDPLRFDGFRFAKMREEAISNGSSGKTFDLVSVNANYLPFGYGRHACPGRFFVAYELKQMLAHVVLNYDVQFKDEGVRPPNKPFMATCFPDPTAEVLFRKR